MPGGKLYSLLYNLPDMFPAIPSGVSGWEYKISPVCVSVCLCEKLGGGLYLGNILDE